MRRGAPLTAQQIATETKVPTDYLFKVLQSLSRARLVQAQRGKNGGFSLMKDPADISIYDVVQAVDPIKRVRYCAKSHN
jgi:Rrf2 family protein